MASTKPAGPVLMAVGNADGTGDGAMPAADVKALARRYCSKGVAVEYQEYQGEGHLEAAAIFEPLPPSPVRGRPVRRQLLVIGLT